MRPALAACCVFASGCAGVDEGRVGRLAQVTVEPALHGRGGDFWAFLYAPQEGFPGPPAQPRAATAASAVRVAQGDAHAVFAAVGPNPYRLWGLLDLDQNFAPQTDVLAQPGAGDRVAQGLEINVQPGLSQRFALDVDLAIEDEPPACRLEDEPTEVVLAQTPGVPTPLTLVVEPLEGELDRARLGFRVGLVDEDQNGVPDDLDGDRVPDLWPRAFMRWQPKPGQGEDGAEVLLPMIFNPAPFLAELAGDLGKSVFVDRLQFGVLAQGQKLTQGPGGQVTVEALGSAPAGSYQLVVLSRTGQYWTLPNDLGATRPSQAVGFRVDRVR